MINLKLSNLQSAYFMYLTKINSELHINKYIMSISTSSTRIAHKVKWHYNFELHLSINNIMFEQTLFKTMMKYRISEHISLYKTAYEGKLRESQNLRRLVNGSSISPPK